MEMQLASLKELVNAEEEGETENASPVVNEEREELPPPPSTIFLDVELLKRSNAAPDEEAMLGCQIITALPDFYKGKCSVLRLHKMYFDNGKPKLYINKYKVVVIALDDSMREIGRMVTHWNNLSKFHDKLIARGINTHHGDNWMPKVINLDLT